MIKCGELTRAIFIVFLAACEVPAAAQTIPERQPLLPWLAPLLPSLPLLPAELSGLIGSAEMERDGTIRLHLRAPPFPAPPEGLRPSVPWPRPEETIGYGEIELAPGDPSYEDLLRHLGGLRPGQSKPVPPWRPEEQWHCALDPDRGACPLPHLLPNHRAAR
jgi:hypothetical protein